MILKLQEASSSKINFPKNQSLWAGSYEKRIAKEEHLVHFGNSVLDNSNWEEIGHSLTKKNIQYLEQSATLFEMKKKIIVNQTL